MHIASAAITLVELYAVGCFTYFGLMLAEDHARKRTMPAWARDPEKPLFTEEEWLILPLSWPWLAYDWICKRIK